MVRTSIEIRLPKRASRRPDARNRSCSRSASSPPARPATTSTRLRGRPTRAQAVASGVEDYYLGGHGGHGALGRRRRRRARTARRGRRRAVASGARRRASGDRRSARAGARGPAARVRSDVLGAEVRQRALRHRRRRACASTLQDAHDEAVADALGYMERQAAVTRRGPAGVHAIAGNGLVAAAFRHRTSRAGDPQLHTHVLVANLTLGADGRWSTLDARRIYAHAKTAGYLYEARLRSIAHARARSRVDAGAQRDRGDRRRSTAGAAGVQPPARGHRGRARAPRRFGRGRGAGRHAGDPARQGLPRHARAAGAGVARARAGPRARARGGPRARRPRAIAVRSTSGWSSRSRAARRRRTG